jgi:hypothetical protein
MSRASSVLSVGWMLYGLEGEYEQNMAGSRKQINAN